MGKRSNFERVERDYYPTPYEAVVPLLDHLAPETRFMEPCAGNGILVEHLEFHGHTCVRAGDVEPREHWIRTEDVFDVRALPNAQAFITNPPWRRDILHPLIDNLSIQAPTWLLFDADWMHTKQSVPYLDHLAKVVSVGRVKWILGSKMTGKDNCCWYLFVPEKVGSTEFVGRKI